MYCLTCSNNPLWRRLRIIEVDGLIGSLDVERLENTLEGHV